MSIESVMLSRHLILCFLLLLLPLIFLSIRVFSIELALRIKWPKFWSFSFSISSFNENTGLICFLVDWFDILAVQGFSRVFSNTTVQEHQFFSDQPSLWLNSHIHEWPLEKLLLWLYGLLLAKWCPCFLFIYLFIFIFYYFFISWRLITLQYCSGFCHTLTWISHGFTCVPHPNPPSHLPLRPIPLGFPSAPGPSTCLMHPTWAGDLFHPR